MARELNTKPSAQPAHASRVLRRVTVVLLLLGAGLGGIFVNPRGGAQDEETADELAERLHQARVRWSRLSKEDQALMRGRYEELQKLDPEQVAILRERSRQLERWKRRLYEELPEEELEELEELPELERPRALRQRLAAETALFGAHMRRLIPEDVLEDLREASPDDREAMMVSIRSRMLNEYGPRIARAAGSQIGMSTEEINGVLALEPDERRVRLVGMQRRRHEVAVRDQGLPPWLTQRQWDRMAQLPDSAFVSRWAKLRERSREHALRDENNAPEVLWTLLHPDPELDQALAEFPPEERPARASEAIRERALPALKRSRLFPRERLRELESLEPGPFVDTARSWMRRQGIVPRPDGPRHESRPGPEGRGAPGPDGPPRGPRPPHGGNDERGAGSSS